MASEYLANENWMLFPKNRISQTLFCEGNSIFACNINGHYHIISCAAALKERRDIKEYETLHRQLNLWRQNLLDYFHMKLLVLWGKMGGHHSKPESRAKAPMAWPPQPPPPFLCPYEFPFPFLPPHPPPKSHRGPKPVSHSVSIPASMPSLETASVPSSKGVSAPALAKIG